MFFFTFVPTPLFFHFTGWFGRSMAPKSRERLAMPSAPRESHGTCDFREIAENRGENRELRLLPPHLTFGWASRSGRFERIVISPTIRKFGTTPQAGVAFSQRPILTARRGFRLTGRNSLR